MNNEEPFLKRWSRRKSEAQEQAKDQEVEASTPAPNTDALALENGEHPQETSPSRPGDTLQERKLTEADFADVDFEALDYKSDYARFTAPGVPETIKNRALQKLWTTNPIFTASDPFQDYQGDYTDAALAVPAGTLKTAYRIGKGFLSDEEVAEWEKLGHPVEADTSAKSPGEAAAATAAAGTGAPVVVAAEPADQPDVDALLRQSDAYFASLYPAQSNHLIDLAALSQPNVRFLVARSGNATAVGCGAIVIGSDGEAELKRMFVVPEARSRRIGGQILEALESAGKAEGVRVIRLETGVRQPESLALYRRHGYTERGPFGTYQRDPLSRYLEKWIA